MVVLVALVEVAGARHCWSTLLFSKSEENHLSALSIETIAQQHFTQEKHHDADILA